MTTTDKKYKPEVVILNRKQIEKLAKIAMNFKEVKWFHIQESHESGIGPTVVVKFDLFDKQDSKIDITDVSTW
jgi:hypothetical protein